MTKSAMQAEALDRARHGQALTNYPKIFEGFMAKGIAEADIKPRENVFTFHAWKALGRSVKKGEHGVRVVTFIDCSRNERDPSTGEVTEQIYRRAHATTVFHISQTELTAEREASRADTPPACGESHPFVSSRRPRTPQVAPIAGMAPLGFGQVRETSAPCNGGTLVTYTVAVPTGFHPIGPEIDRDDD